MSENIIEIEPIYLTQEEIHEIRPNTTFRETIIDNTLVVENKYLNLCFLCGLPSFFLLVIVLVIIFVLHK